MEINGKYNAQEKKLDQYLGTNNLRPGPPRKLIYKMENFELDKQDKNMRPGTQSTKDKIPEKEIPKKKMNYFSYSREMKKNIAWDE